MTLFSRINKDCPWNKFSVHLLVPKIGIFKKASEMGEGSSTEILFSYPTEISIVKSQEHCQVSVCFFGFGLRIFRQWTY